MIEYYDAYFPAINQTRKLHIYLPDDYYDSENSYPVTYFFDGQNLFFDQMATYGKSWGLYDFLENWPKKMIVVGLECGHQGNERLSEYSPYDIDSDFFGGHVDGRGKETMEWLVNDVKPYIDSHYRTYPFREATGIAGSSMGGLMVIYALARYNAVFSKAACLSSAILGNLEADVRASSIDSDTRIYLSWGSQEAGPSQGGKWESRAARANLSIETAFQEQKATTYVYCQDGGRHQEADWEKQVPIFMDFLWMQ
ncbi:alpha/beta hydrolase [Streptococcus downei]|uniref:Esterase n=1 Tax=Streptococcus downei MFe28 TaxID=764290 RepID=A0A380JE92_STRDO|nr:alpha/beta hydrolase-fold protein [Streptococcus downei]EFQ57685.1 putative esterase [Streptococcus downei F0415]SUN36389.1 esterase [Streptococcus downei MFe28]